MPSDRFVIRGHHPLRNALLALAALLLGVLVAVGAYWQGGSAAALELDRLRTDDRSLRGELHRLGQDRFELRRRVTELEQKARVDDRSLAELRAHLDEQVARLGELEESVSFFQGILAADDPERRLRIHSFTLAPVDSDSSSPGDGRAFRFELVLTQYLRSDKVTAGVVDLFLVGTLAGSLDRKRYSELSSDAPPLVFSFRNFQRLAGRILVPAEFAPHAVTVQVAAQLEGKTVRVARKFDWAPQS